MKYMDVYKQLSKIAEEAEEKAPETEAEACDRKNTKQHPYFTNSIQIFITIYCGATTTNPCRSKQLIRLDEEIVA